MWERVWVWCERECAVRWTVPSRLTRRVVPTLGRAGLGSTCWLPIACLPAAALCILPVLSLASSHVYRGPWHSGRRRALSDPGCPERTWSDLDALDDPYGPEDPVPFLCV